MKVITGFFQLRIRSFLYGAGLPLDALKLILRTPKLIALSALPVAISLALYVYVILQLQTAGKAWATDYFLSQGWNSSQWMTVVVQVGLSILLFLVGAFTFSIVTSVVASPFNDWLAEKTESYTTPVLPPAPALRLAGRARIILIDVLKTLAATAATIVAILLSWVPILNVLSMALAFLLVTFQYVSYPQTRRAQGILYGARFLFRYFYCCLGFGAVISILFTLPLLSVFAVPVAVVGGTLLVGRAQDHLLR